MCSTTAFFFGLRLRWIYKGMKPGRSIDSDCLCWPFKGLGVVLIFNFRRAQLLAGLLSTIFLRDGIERFRGFWTLLLTFWTLNQPSILRISIIEFFTGKYFIFFNDFFFFLRDEIKDPVHFVNPLIFFLDYWIVRLHEFLTKSLSQIFQDK